MIQKLSPYSGAYDMSIRHGLDVKTLGRFFLLMLKHVVICSFHKEVVDCGRIMTKWKGNTFIDFN